MTSTSNVCSEKLLTIKQAAALIGVPDWKLYKAVKRGDVPHHTLFNSRKLVFLSEINSAIRRANGDDLVDPPAAQCSSDGTQPKNEERSRDSSTGQQARSESTPTNSTFQEKVTTR